VLHALAKNPNLLPNKARLGKVNSKKFRNLVAKFKKQKTRSSRGSSPVPSPLSREVVILPYKPTNLGPNNYIEIGNNGRPWANILREFEKLDELEDFNEN
jgi:hypothetical protein